MNKTTKYFIGVVVIVIIILLFTYTDNDQGGKVTSDEPIKIGAILYLTGDFAPFGTAINQGALLAVENAREQGLNVEYIPEDDQSTVSGSVNAANKLVNVDKVDGVITATVQEVKPVTKIFNGSDIPLVATWDSNDFIKAAGPNIFTIGFSTEHAGQIMAQHAFNELGVSDVAVVTQIDEWSELISSAFEKEFLRLSGNVVFAERIQPYILDFRTLITKIKGNGAEGIYMPLIPTTIAPFLNQAGELGYESVIMTGDSFSQDEIDQSANGAEGIFFSNLHSDASDDIVSQYINRYGEAPNDPIFVTFGYDGVNVLIDAVLLAKDKKISVLEAMHEIRTDGVDGEIFFGDGQFSEKFERLYTVAGGKIVEVE